MLMKKPNSTVNHIQIATSIQERRPVIGLLRVTSAGLIGLALAVGVLALTRPVVVRGAGPWYVATTGSPANNCLGPATPCDTLQRAIDLASAGDTINVAADTFTVPAGPAVVTVTKSLILSGGWNSGFTAQSGATVVDGQNARRGMLIDSGAPTTIISFTLKNGLVNTGAITGGAGIASSSPVVLIDVTLQDNESLGGGGGLLALDTVTLTRGLIQANSCTSSTCHGAGVSVDGSAMVKGTAFVANTGAHVGGGLFVAGNLTISNARFEGNQADHSGGGLYTNLLVLTDTVFYTNTVGWQGGALYAWGQASLMRPIARDNQAQDEGGGFLMVGPAVITSGTIESNQSLIAAGGGIASYGPLDLRDTAVISNSASTFGGGVRSNGGITVTGGLVKGNTADRGGGVHIEYQGSNTLISTRIVSNSADLQGGGILVHNTGGATVGLSIVNSFVGSNSAGVEGNEIATFGSTASNVGLSHVTLAAGATGPGPAISVGQHANNDSLTITNAIFHGYGVAVASGAQPASVAVDAVLWSGVTTPTQTSNSPILLTHAVVGPALLVNQAAYDYHITLGSAAYNAGVASSVTTDIDGEARPLYGLPDLGADELNLATDLMLSQSSAPAAATPGAPVSYTLIYTNAGPRIAYGPILTDSIPTSLLTDIAFTSSGAVITPTLGTTYTWQIADVAPGSGGTITVTARLRSNLGAPSVVANTAVIESWVGDTVPADNSSSADVRVESPITGLQVQHNGPKAPNAAVAFTATVTTGSSVTYAWNFGDGTLGTGANTSHTYLAIGAYTATVTATNPLGSAVVQIPVTIADLAITGLAINGPATTPVNKATNYAATITAGSNVTYAWQIDGAAAGSGATVPLTFSTTGSHTVTVTATNTAGSQFATLVVTVVPNRLYFPTVSK